MSIKEELTVAVERLYEGKIINLRRETVRLPDGRLTGREIIEHPGAVAVVPFLGEKELIMVRQYRKPVEQVLLEIPAGKLERGEDPAACALRELQEETGYRAGKLMPLLRLLSSPGFSDEVLHLFVARELVPVEQSLDEDEFLEVERIPLAQALAAIKKGEIADAKSIVGILGAVYLL